MIPEDCKQCPEGGYCPGQQECGCKHETMSTLRAQLTASQQAALDYHRRWQEAEAKMVAMEEARNAAMRAEGEAKAAVKLLRKALELALSMSYDTDEPTEEYPNPCHVWVVNAREVLDATELEGEQGCQSKS